jgi:hypothetical protein
MPLSFFRRRAHLNKRIFPWKPNVQGAQDYVPVETVTKKLGIKKGEKVLVFAGYYGDWANALSHSTQLTYTDPSKEFANLYARKHSGARVKAVAAELVPLRPKKYDWSFSFEPFPVAQNGGLLHSMTRALLNNKGAKVVLSNQDLSRNQIMQKTIDSIAKIYGAKVGVSKFSLNVMRVMDSLSMIQKSDAENLRISEALPKKENLHLITLLTNPIARKRARLDISVGNIIDKAIKKRARGNYNQKAPKGRVLVPSLKTQQRDYAFAQTLIPELSRRLALPPAEIRSSINRINRLAQMYAQ